MPDPEKIFTRGDDARVYFEGRAKAALRGISRIEWGRGGPAHVGRNSQNGPERDAAKRTREYGETHLGEIGAAVRKQGYEDKLEVNAMIM